MDDVDGLKQAIKICRPNLKLAGQIRELSRDHFIDEVSGSYTDLYLQAQKYNHLFKDDAIVPVSCPELHSPVLSDNISVAPMRDIPESQKIYTVKNKNNIYYYYTEFHSKLAHNEGPHIFFSIQKERLKALIGHVARLFNKDSTLYSDSFYFRNNEQNKEDFCYSDAPLDNSENITYYWLGHAASFISIPVGKAKVTLVTDPVEGNLNYFFVRRMTKLARYLEDCPMPHIFLLTHNHLDHYQKSSLRKLVPYQPLVIAPKGDKNRLNRLGFKKVLESDWWETITIPVNEDFLKITIVPANHWAGQNPFNFFKSAFQGYILHTDKGDIYYAGDTARLSLEHIQTLLRRFDIKVMFQPGGPDEIRADMKRTHQSSIDAIWMYFKLPLMNLYLRNNYLEKSKEAFIQESRQIKTIFMHLKAYKLGNVHFDDTEVGVARVKSQLLQNSVDLSYKIYEQELYLEILELGKQFVFLNGTYLESQDILSLIDSGVIIPILGSRISL